jgi:hypothetical protein
MEMALDGFTPIARQTAWPLLSRGWIYQERRLSPHIIHFGNQKITRACQSWKGYEDSNIGEDALGGMPMPSSDSADHAEPNEDIHHGTNCPRIRRVKPNVRDRSSPSNHCLGWKDVGDQW